MKFKAGSIRFRPLTGIVVLIQYRDLLEQMEQIAKFPSPYGDCGSYQRGRHQGYCIHGHQFPSPYGDCGSYPWRTFPLCRFFRRRFRPLTGIVVLIRL